ncbi:MAG: hypothetical protein JWO60_3177 [Frankiales bacterium]|nr:hypothetical protein [Frankiales bacterium]
MEPHELDARAASLRALADEVEEVVTAPLQRALQPVWRCPHADQVGDALRTQRAQARTAAERLRETARRLHQQAERIREERAAERRRQEDLAKKAAEAKAERDAARAGP